MGIGGHDSDGDDDDEHMNVNNYAHVVLMKMPMMVVTLLGSFGIQILPTRKKKLLE